MFLKNHPQVLTIEHKFCEPGHSTIQEVDNLHSQIEQVCGNSEIYSPVGLLRMLKKVHRRKPLKLIQLRPQDFKDFHTIARRGQYKRIPFSKVKCLLVKCLLFEQKKPKVLKDKKHISDDWNEENVIERKTTRSGITEVLFQVPDHEVAKVAEALTQAKKMTSRLC